MNEDVILIKIGRSYKDNLSPEELYQATSRSWVVKLEDKKIKYFCAVVEKKILEVYKFLYSELNKDKVAYFDELGYEKGRKDSKPNRYILHGELAEEEIREKLIGLDVSELHKGSGNPIKYVMLKQLIGRENIEKEPKVIKSSEVVNEIYNIISLKGYIYSSSNVNNLYLSLRSKPFVILSGISGTGKTKIVELFAEAVGATYENGRFKLIPVRPDWSDSSDLLGYKDLKNDFIQGPLTKMIIQAHENPDYPHFVVLDEMNLARVEYYLSDFLSVIESRKFSGAAIKTAPIVEFNGQSYGIPDNLYIIGTVNMDETTHPFSKKVLDRANTIEFNEVHLTNFSFFNDNQEFVESVEAKNDLFKSKFIQLPDAVEYMGVIKAVSEELEQINAILSSIYAQVGYRVRDEIAFYMSYNEEYQLLSRDEAMDFCIMQKILPRISGAGKEVEDVLDNLLTLFTGDLAGESNLSETVKYPRSVTKLKEMKTRYGTQGFVSYWIS